MKSKVKHSGSVLPLCEGICHGLLLSPVPTSGGRCGRPRRSIFGTRRCRRWRWRPAQRTKITRSAPYFAVAYSFYRRRLQAASSCGSSRVRRAWATGRGGRRSCGRRGRGRFESIQMVLARWRVIFFFFFRIFGPKNKAPWPSSGLQKGRGKGGGG